MSKLNLNPMADWGYVNNSRFRFLSIRNQGGGDSPVPPEPVIPTDRILYTVVTGGYKPESYWIDEYTDLSKNTFNEETGEGELFLLEGVNEFYIDEYINNSIFNDNVDNNIESVIIPLQIESVSRGAFNKCKKLKYITIPKSVTYIEETAFSGCSDLEKIVISKNNNVYDSRNDCNAIIETETNTLIVGCKNTTISNSVTSISYDAFYSRKSPSVLDIPESVESIGEYAFRDCIELNSVTIPNSVTYIGCDAFNNTSIESVIIPDSITCIEFGTFANCTSLQTVIIPDSVVELQDTAYGTAGGVFENCQSLNSIVLPKNIKTIGKKAFFGCTNLTSVTCYVVNPPSFGLGMFDNTPKQKTLYVPAESVQAYLNDTDWNTAFNGNIQAIQ